VALNGPEKYEATVKAITGYCAKLKPGQEVELRTVIDALLAVDNAARTKLFRAAVACATSGQKSLAPYMRQSDQVTKGRSSPVKGRDLRRWYCRQPSATGANGETVAGLDMQIQALEAKKRELLGGASQPTTSVVTCSQLSPGGELITVTEFARRVGVTRQAVNKNRAKWDQFRKDGKFSWDAYIARFRAGCRSYPADPRERQTGCSLTGPTWPGKHCARGKP
jgi:hypothetical protein